MSGTASRWTAGVFLWGWLGRGAKNVLGCSTTILLVVVVLLTPQEVAAPRTDSIIRSYFEKGFCVFSGVPWYTNVFEHARRLRRLNPRRRGCYGSSYYTGQCVLVIATVFVMNYVLCIRASVDALCRTARVKSHVIRVQNASKLGEKA